MRCKYREKSLPNINEYVEESMYNTFYYNIKCTLLMINNELLGIPPSQKDTMKSCLLDNAEPIDRSFHSYSTNHTQCEYKA